MQDDQYHRGLATRRQVMGDAFVDRALAGTTPFTQPIQDHISRAAWGDVWQREGLDRKTRSLVTVAMLTALGKQHELKGHVRGALNNGATDAGSLEGDAGKVGGFSLHAGVAAEAHESHKLEKAVPLHHAPGDQRAAAVDLTAG